MGKKDAITKEYVKNPEVFADAFNLFLYQGRQKIKPEDLRELDTAEIAVPYRDGGSGLPEQRYRDVMKLLTMMTDGECAFCILGIENQSDIHYAMPVRNGLYDFLQLARQVADTEKRHKDPAYKKCGEKISSGEFLGGFWRTDKLIPVVTLVIYFGADQWDAPLTLKEMYACDDERVLAYAADHRVNLLAPGNLRDEEIALFRSGLREVMQFIKYSDNLQKIREMVDNNEQYRNIDRATAELINVVTNSKFQFQGEEEETDMCKAMDMLREEGRNEGRIVQLIAQVCRKIEKGKSVERIAEDLEAEVAEIQRIYDTAVKYAPDYDEDQIYAELNGKIVVVA